MNVLKCILVQKVGFVKYKSGLLHGYKMKKRQQIYLTFFFEWLAAQSPFIPPQNVSCIS